MAAWPPRRAVSASREALLSSALTHGTNVFEAMEKPLAFSSSPGAVGWPPHSVPFGVAGSLRTPQRFQRRPGNLRISAGFPLTTTHVVGERLWFFLQYQFL